MKDPTAFIFTLYNKDGYYPEKMRLKNFNREFILFDVRNNGPTFGGGHDIKIVNHASDNSDSYYYYCHTFTCSSFSFTDSEKSKDRIKFTQDDIEVLYETNT